MSTANGTETVAVPQVNGSYKLYGFKWFTSATDANMTLTLARVQDRYGATTPVILCFYNYMKLVQVILCRPGNWQVTVLFGICLSFRVARVCLCSMQRSVEMRGAS